MSGQKAQGVEIRYYASLGFKLFQLKAKILHTHPPTSSKRLNRCKFCQSKACLLKRTKAESSV